MNQIPRQEVKSKFVRAGQVEVTIEPLRVKYQPHLDADGRRNEDAEAYVQRMRGGDLLDWPDEVLREWLYRHWNQIEKYQFLNFERFRFTRESWPSERVPGCEAMDGSDGRPLFTGLFERARDPWDWLARYMVEHGTWNTPIVLLDNRRADREFPDDGRALKAPFHLLEGHRRLSLFQELRDQGRAAAAHDVWLVRIAAARSPGRKPDRYS